MKIMVAGQDLTGDLGPELKRRAGQMACGGTSRQPAVFPETLNIEALARTRTEEAYLTELMRLLRCREGVDTHPYAMPCRPGWRGKFMVVVRKALWKLLRYQHDRMTFRQNLVNSQLTSALEFEMDQRRRETADLRQRLDDLERRIGEGRP